VSTWLSQSNGPSHLNPSSPYRALAMLAVRCQRTTRAGAARICRRSPPRTSTDPGTPRTDSPPTIRPGRRPLAMSGTARPAAFRGPSTADSAASAVTRSMTIRGTQSGGAPGKFRTPS
jgi:hypothetical protein